MIGFAGLGDLGSAIAAKLMTSGHELMVWNRTPARAEALVARGARLASSPTELIGKCDLVCLCVTSDVASAELAQNMFAARSRNLERSVIVDFSTGSPSAAAKLAQQANALNLGWVDAPVSGGTGAAAVGTLTIFVGGAAADVERAFQLLETVGSNITRAGPPGAGQALKLCNQMIVASTIASLAEMFTAAHRAGIACTDIPAAFKGGFADSAPLQVFGPRMAERRHTPRLGSIALMAKDLGLARDFMKEFGAVTPIADLCSRLYARAEDPAADLSRLIDLFEVK